MSKEYTKEEKLAILNEAIKKLEEEIRNNKFLIMSLEGQKVLVEMVK